MATQGTPKVIETVNKNLPAQGTQQNHDVWHRAFEHSPIGIALTDAKGRFLAANAAYQKMLCYTEEELRRSSFLEITKDGGVNNTLLSEVIDGKREQCQLERHYQRKDGSLIWIRDNVSRVPGTEKVSQFLMTVIEDITQHKLVEEQLQKKKAHLEDLFEQSPGAVVLLDANHRVVHVNQEFTRVFGYSREEAVGRHISELITPEEFRDEAQRCLDLIV